MKNPRARVFVFSGMLLMTMAGCDRQGDRLPNYPPPPTPETSPDAVKPLTTPGVSSTPRSSASTIAKPVSPGESSIELRHKIESGESTETAAREQANPSPKADGNDRGGAAARSESK